MLPCASFLEDPDLTLIPLPEPRDKGGRERFYGGERAWGKGLSQFGHGTNISIVYLLSELAQPSPQDS